MLCATEERYRQIFETTHEGIWIANLDGICTSINPQMSRMLGANPEEIINRSVFDYVFPQDRGAVQQHFQEFLREPSGKRVEERLRRKDGAELWVLVAASILCDRRAQPVGFLGMFTDITDRKRAEQALRDAHDALEVRVRERTAELRATNRALADNEEKYRRLFETISDAAFVFEGKSRQFVEVNEAALRLYGYTRAQFLGTTYGAITAEPEDSEAMIRLTLAGKAPRIPLRYQRKKDGTIFPVEISASTFTLQGRQMAYGVVRDITRRVELEREIVAISEREQRRLGQDLHDDLCQQLAGIEFLSQGLASDLAPLSPARARQAKEIARLVQRAVSQARELAHGLVPVQLDAEGLTAALRELAAGTRKVFGRDCRFRCERPVRVPDHTVAIHLYRIAQEAVSNALKHGQPRHIELSLTAAGRAITLAVKDDGTGISRRPPNPKGTGLRIMRYRAEVIGGALTVQSDPRSGTSVVCTVVKGLQQHAAKPK